MAVGPELDAYLDLSGEEIARVILMLLVEEALRNQLAPLRQNLEPQPVQRLEEFRVGRHDVVGIGHAAR